MWQPLVVTWCDCLVGVHWLPCRTICLCGYGGWGRRRCRLLGVSCVVCRDVVLKDRLRVSVWWGREKIWREVIGWFWLKSWVVRVIRLLGRWHWGEPWTYIQPQLWCDNHREWRRARAEGGTAKLLTFASRMHEHLRHFFLGTYFSWILFIPHTHASTLKAHQNDHWRTWYNWMKARWG